MAASIVLLLHVRIYLQVASYVLFFSISSVLLYSSTLYSVEISVKDTFISPFYHICRVRPTAMIPWLSVPFNPESQDAFINFQWFVQSPIHTRS